MADMTVTGAVKRELAVISKRDKTSAESALAAAALALAAEIDGANSATSKSMCAKELRETLDRLRAQAPAQRETDSVDDLTARRARRVSAS